MGLQRLVALIGAMTVAIAGCSSEDTTTPTASTPSPTPAATPIPQTALAPAAQPLVVQKKQSTRAVAGLIQPTNAEERAKQIESEIRNNATKNPFVGLPPALPRPTSNPSRPVPTIAELPKTGAAVPKTGASRPGTRPARPTSSRANSPTANSPIASGPLIPPISLGENPTLPKAQDAPLGFNVPPVLPPPPAAPVPPSTTTASAVEITGVVFVGNSPQAIVIAPGDPGSRYVGVGQRISGGRVLIKRIEMGAGSIPVVILEENGVEVAKSVGERSTAPANQASQQINRLRS
ncbi:hypothetical protein JOY44_19400 [Phormidium sp. CLA17]|uniref:hypothetical protein n=1 Tax=Leptolyngbya sp. Cla-17 TaxID=2803751 RepID=UPI0019329D51|nr:hypothetical protein [Leptolyngbya sp. Cla-17]MBM0743757.1 hypothetical protein [Leptolyngbya sp. Cla-17]